MEKSYNPFRMWGAWLGGVLYLIPLLLGMSGTFCSGWGCLVFFIVYIPFISILNFSSGLFMTGIIIFIIGFLIGWGIHSLFRRFRN